MKVLRKECGGLYSRLHQAGPSRRHEQWCCTQQIAPGNSRSQKILIPLRNVSSVQLFKKIVMLVAEKAAVDVVYCPIAVIPVASVVPLSSVCSCVMNAE